MDNDIYSSLLTPNYQSLIKQLSGNSSPLFDPIENSQVSGDFDSLMASMLLGSSSDKEVDSSSATELLGNYLMMPYSNTIMELLLSQMLSNQLGAPQAVALQSGVTPDQFDAQNGCVLYAAARRSDLGTTGAPDGGAAGYIDNPRFKNSTFQLEATDTNLKESIATGYALVWPRGVLDGAGGQYGHVAIVEGVSENAVIVSQAGWGNQHYMKINREDFDRWNLHIIP